MPWEADNYCDRNLEASLSIPGCADGDAHRQEARRFYLAAPSFRIQFETDGAVSLCMKRYEYWEQLAPEDATEWHPISRHKDLEEAERRLRHVCSSPVYYDAEGRLARAPRTVTPLWNLPPDDDD
jgi:hypothetical protein